MSDLTIRPAVPDDAATIHAFIGALEEHVEARGAVPATVEDFRRDMFGDQPAAHADLLERDGVPIGLITWYPIYSTWLGRRGLYALDVYIADNERGQGHGRRLLRHLAQRAHAMGGAFLKLDVDHTNEDAAAVYVRFGFKPSASDPYLLMGDAFTSMMQEA
jgi:ribosomal protein S18 acetylase RimI-like enzyme